MLQKLIPNYELFLRVVGDADPYGSRRKLTVKLASFGKGGGFCEAKDGGLEIKNNYFFGGSKPPALLCAGIFCIVEFFGRPRGVAVKFCVFTDSRKGCPYDLHTVKTNIFGHG